MPLACQKRVEGAPDWVVIGSISARRFASIRSVSARRFVPIASRFGVLSASIGSADSVAIGRNRS